MAVRSVGGTSKRVSVKMRQVLKTSPLLWHVQEGRLVDFSVQRFYSDVSAKSGQQLPAQLLLPLSPQEKPELS